MILSPGKETATAIDQSSENASAPDPRVLTSSQSITHSDKETGDSEAAVAAPKPTQAPDSSEMNRASARSKKPTKFFGDPLRHSVEAVEEEASDHSSSAVKSLVTLTSPHKRIELIHQRPCLIAQEQATPFKKTKFTEEPNENNTQSDI